MKNYIDLIGNTGDDVKMHFFEGGGCVGRFPLATSHTYKNKAGEKVTETQWHNCVISGKGAETFEKYVKKGHRVNVSGMIKYRKWQDESGQDRYSTEIVVRDFVFLQPKEESPFPAQASSTTTRTAAPAANSNNASARAAASAPPLDSYDDEEHDDLPF